LIIIKISKKINFVSYSRFFKMLKSFLHRQGVASFSLYTAAVCFSVPALAYEVDPLTRQPLVSQVEGYRAQATTIPREIVNYSGNQRAGTIVISTKERRMYLVLGDGKAMRYGVGVGRPGFEWGGAKNITLKREWPDWRPPAQMLKRRPDLPRYMPGGPNNPLGARALYLGSTLYRIHGSNEPETIGQAVSSGCIRMLNDDVVDLYSRVKVGTRVVVQR
jgi:lipoprotein-anchoring transpeptidase ErfK/SrfK